METPTRKHDQREHVAQRLAAHLLDTGLSQTSLRQLAAAAGVSDRMLLYYFADKAEALACTLTLIAGDFATALGEAIPVEPKLAPAPLLAKATALTLGPQVRSYMALWIDIVAAAARGEPPYGEIAGQIAAGFLDFLEQRLACDPSSARGNALALLAMVDGLALIAACMGEDHAAEAAVAMQQLALGVSGTG